MKKTSSSLTAKPPTNGRDDVDINWCVHWGSVLNPGTTEGKRNRYKVIVRKYIKAWIELINEFLPEGADPYDIKDFQTPDVVTQRFNVITTLEPAVIEGIHPPGKGLKEGFIDHLIPPSPPPPPDDFFFSGLKKLEKGAKSLAEKNKKN